MTDGGQGTVDRDGHVHPLGGQFGHAGIVTRDLQELVEQRLEAVEFLVKQFHRPLADRVQILAALVEHVGGHPHGGQRCAQLVADVRGELPLQSAELLEMGDLLGQALGHVVEGHREPGHVVLTADRHSLLQSAVGEPHRDPRRRPHRDDDLTRHEPRDRGQQTE